MSFYRQTEKAAEDLSDPIDSMIRMCGFVFENLRSAKLPGRPLPQHFSPAET